MKKNTPKITSHYFLKDQLSKLISHITDAISVRGFQSCKSIMKKKTLKQINPTILFPRVQKQLLVTTSMRNLKKKTTEKKSKTTTTKQSSLKKGRNF